MDPGSLIRADNTVLTTIVSEDVMWVDFDIDERTLLRLQQLAREKKIPAPWDYTTLMEPSPWLNYGIVQSVAAPLLNFGQQLSGPKRTVRLGLADEEGFPHEGALIFADNMVNRQTGTRRLRAAFDNRDRHFYAGMYARIEVPIGQPHDALLVPERALGSEQGRKYLYVVNDENKVIYRSVRIGAQHGNLRVIDEGLSDGERIIVSGQQRAKAGAPVEPKLVALPSDKDGATTPQLITSGAH